VESKRLIFHALQLHRERGDDHGVAEALGRLCTINQTLGLFKEGMQQVEETLEIAQRLGDTVRQAQCLKDLALLLHDNNQLDVAEEAAFCMINLLSERDDPFLVCESHKTLGKIYRSKGEMEKAIHHFEVALGTASSFGWHDELFSTHYNLAWLYRDEGRLDDAQAHAERAKSHAVNIPYNLGLAMEMQAVIWYRQDRLEEAKTEALRAADVFEKLGAAGVAKDCRDFLRKIENSLVATSGQPALNCELLQTTLFPAHIDFSF